MNEFFSFLNRIYRPRLTKELADKLARIRRGATLNRILFGKL